MRWLKFSAVGALGVAVQAGFLALFIYVLSLHYLLATALALEVTLLHNFCWHWKWTWADRRFRCPAIGSALLRFHLTNGGGSFAGNLLFMRILAGAAGLEPVAANLLSIVLCSLLNFFLADRVVFALSGSAVDKGLTGLSDSPIESV